MGSKKDKFTKAEERDIIRFVLRKATYDSNIHRPIEFTAFIGKEDTEVTWIDDKDRFYNTEYKTKAVRELFDGGTWIKI